MKVLVTGGVRSGKSRHAESLLSGAVTYLAPGPVRDDADWAERIEAHRARRPRAWTTVESADLVGVIARTDGHVIVDCLGTWLTAVMDEGVLWDASAETATRVVGDLSRETADVIRGRAPGVSTVLVTNEVGWGVVPEYRSGRLFRDLLGIVNQELAAACDEVHLVVAGRTLVL